MRIYQSLSHLLITLITISLPFVFIGYFSYVAGLQTQHLFAELFISGIRLFAAYLIALVVSWTLAALFSRGKAAAVALPVFDVLQSFPTFAALPLVSYLWGASSLTVVFFLVITVIWPMLFSTISSLRLIRKDWEEAVEISGLKGLKYIRYFLLPASVPGLVTGSIVGLGEGWEALVATEIILQIKFGLGSFFQEFSHNTVVTAFGILGFLLVIYSMNRIIWIPLLDWSHRTLEE